MSTKSTATLHDVLAQPMDGVARILLRHVRRRRFRWLFLIELAVTVVACVCTLPILLVIATIAGADVEGPSFERIGDRAFRYWHELVLQMLDGKGNVVTEIRQTPRDAAEGEAILRSLLLAATREQVVVVEMLGDAPGEILNAWYGGQPLLAVPDFSDVGRALRVLEDDGYRISQEVDRHELVRTDDRREGLLAWVSKARLPTGSSRRARMAQRLRSLALDILRRAPATWTTEIRADGLTLTRARGESVRHQIRVDGADLLGIAWSATLGYDRDVRRRMPHVRLITRQRMIELPAGDSPEVGRALRDLLIAATLQLRSVHPELGLQGPGARPAHCPFCGTLYVFEPGARCPSCGAPATKAEAPGLS